MSLGLEPGEEYFLEAATIGTTVLEESIRQACEKCLNAYKSLHKSEFLSFTFTKLTLMECGPCILEDPVLEKTKETKTLGVFKHWGFTRLATHQIVEMCVIL